MRIMNGLGNKTFLFFHWKECSLKNNFEGKDKELKPKKLTFSISIRFTAWARIRG